MIKGKAKIMDKIYLNDLEFYAYHGVFDFEKEEGQTFFVSLVLEMDLAPAGTSDDLNQTANYGTIYDIVAEITLSHKYDLIETLAERIAAAVLEEFPKVAAVTVRVDKPKAPGSVKFHAAVEIRREQS